MNYDLLLQKKPYSMNQEEKEKYYISYMKELTAYHKKFCKSYRNILDMLCYDEKSINELKEIPMIPVTLFKKHGLFSIDEEDIFKVMTSSGTTGQEVSKIFLDKKTAEYQQKTLFNIVSDFIGPKRIPMIIIDSPEVLKNRAMFSARGAGILGFSIFASQRIYALDKEMNFDVEKVKSFLEKHKDEKILIFGFTYMIWEYFYKVLKRECIDIDLSNGILIHGGGWKKLKDKAVSKEEFKSELRNICKIDNVHNYYGMVEQTGCIYMECEYGHLHVSSYSEIITRKMRDFEICDIGEEGVIQVISPMAESYPGHSILTEDKGVILGIDDCPCGRKGKYFEVTGRIKAAEIRGCSDTYEI